MESRVCMVSADSTRYLENEKMACKILALKVQLWVGR